VLEVHGDDDPDHATGLPELLSRLRWRF
jgi:hypothetical protein